MKPATTSEAPASECPETHPSEKAYGDFRLPPQTLPDLVGSNPILPAWLSDRLRKLFSRAAPRA